ncbi:MULTISPECIES: hypothetical protein [unclassified Mesorhizobium]|uniref:hypothetical protein n=1 Tax=unclassified Mesorhizobium TaxID=325217 RepID=UPI000BAE9F45|nr:MULTISPECIES: hypothetical protein [unclassified Mesorhizobium]TGT61057.1 hypothetical protein EN813_019035 [Mesorhizobium sp. M00.F.Ca.ET.170.01.1.1]AZO08826.1 hypothetical protein EJ074_06660 [Mesorhizobium sp. M3A.F.Ca.ET.080.04.2.1]RWB67423.1 MAG: hypothetical protein EOQ49_25525 [Mesorhizobium sp.]RWB83746.1 MAG: hypothetical protein EOQ52_26485 [Mesorhizobium sp.]RWE23961.1 MAG: hypothetical protein EOS41_18720 [Mesorhizobium sp.]
MRIDALPPKEAKQWRYPVLFLAMLHSSISTRQTFCVAAQHFSFQSFSNCEYAVEELTSLGLPLSGTDFEPGIGEASV